jgi:PAS domain S-box-containing protein
MIMETHARSSYPDSPQPGYGHPSNWIAKPYSIVFTAVFFFILIFGIAIFLGYRQFETTRHNALTADKTTANLLADLILEHNKTTIGILQSYAYRPLFVAAMKNKDIKGTYRHLADLKKNAEIDLTFVTDNRGILLVNFPLFPESAGKDLSYRDWYKGVSSQWRPYISTVFKLIVGDKPLAVAVCVPIFDEKGRAIGILGDTQRLGFLVDTIERVPFSPYTTVNVIDRAGHILYSNKFPYQESITDYRFFPILEPAVKEKKQQTEMNDPQKDHEKSYLTVVPVGDIGWSVIFERSLRDIYRSEFRRFIEIGAVSFLLFLLIIFFLIYLRKANLFRKTEEILHAEIKLRQGEKALRHQNEMLRTILDSIPVMVAFLDREGRHQLVNRCWQSTLGWSLEEAQYKDILAEVYPDPAYRKYVMDYIAAAAGTWSNFKTRTRDGRVLDTSWVNVPLLDGSNIGIGIDITSRKQAEEALRESEENFRRSLDDSPLGVRIVTIEGETIYANRAILDIYGYDSVEELRTTPIKNRYTPQSYAEFKIRREKRKGGDDGPSKYEISIVRKNGEIRDLQVFRKHILWDGERQFQVLYNDITERKRAEEALKFTRFSVDNAAETMVCVDRNARFIDVNDTFCRSSGYSREELLSMTVHDIDPDYSAEIWPEFWEKLKKSGSLTFETCHHSKEGRIFPVEITANFFEYKGKEYHCGFAHDITERKRAEEALKKSEAEYRRLYENSMMGISEALPDGRLIRVNMTYANMYGYVSPDEMMAKVVDIGQQLYANPEDRKEVLRILGEKGHMESREFPVVRRDGSPFYVLVAAREMRDVSGKLVCYQATHADITDRKRAEEALRASREQMRALAGRLQAVREEERTRIAREIHDELGGVLTGLKIDFSLLTRAALKIENKTVRKSLLAGMDSMIESVDATIHTVRRIAMELRPGVLDDLGLVAALEWQLKDFEKRTGVRCEFFPSVEDISLDADLSTAVFRIFQETLTNVARHSGATEVHVRLSVDADSSTLEVEDNGKGIKEKNILSSKSLGLLGMRERAQMFGGRITVKGTPGRGTKVTVEIPSVEKRKMDRDQEGADG